MGYRDRDVAAKARKRSLERELREASELLEERRAELARLETELDRAGRALELIVAGSPAWQAAAVALIMATCTLAAGLSSVWIGTFAAVGMMIALLAAYTIGQASIEKRWEAARAALVERLNAPGAVAAPRARVEEEEEEVQEDEVEEGVVAARRSTRRES